MRIGIVAGEHSGDQLAANLIIALRAHYPQIEVEGIAGPQMLAAGCKAIVPMEQIAVMGLFEVVRHLPALLSARRRILKHFYARPPDIFIGIDAPDFNLTLEEKLRACGVKTVHYVSPSVWAWRQGRLKKIARAVDLMLTLLPFEAQFYRERNIPVQFVGHYLADEIPLAPEPARARQLLNLPYDATIVALLPGSRVNEINYLAELFLMTARQLRVQQPALIFIAPMINATRAEQFTAIWQRVAPELDIVIYPGKQSREVMLAADVVLVASGTATLEAMLLKKPMVVAYRMAVLTYALAKRLVKVPFIALPNLLAGRKIVPEFIQQAASAENLTAAVLRYLNDAEQISALQTGFTELHQQLRQDASARAAHAILKLTMLKN